MYYCGERLDFPFLFWHIKKKSNIHIQNKYHDQKPSSFS